MKHSFTDILKKYKTKILVLASGFAIFIVLIQNIKYFRSTVKEVFHEKKDDLIIIDKYIVSDSLELRIMNIGDKTIALREAIISVDTTYKIQEEPMESMDFVSATYGLSLNDSSKSYQVAIRLSQSIKPNESDRFAFKIQGGVIINFDSLRLLMGEPFYYGNYFIQFRVKLFLNNTNESISTEPIVHYFEKRNFHYSQKHDTVGVGDNEKKYYLGYYKNRDIALKINKLKCYKSPPSVLAIEKILSE